MNIRFQYKIAFVFALAGLQGAFAQKKDENIGSEVVNVVKPYTPTISDAFKVKETPVIEDEDNTQREEIKYNIFSFPVASTFAPAKGRAAGVEKEKQEKLFSNYATLGAGNYGTVNAELFVTHNIDRNKYVGGMLRHLSSQGGIDDAVLDDKYYNTSIDLTYGNRQQTYNWNIDAGYQHQIYNWYGVISPALLPPYMFFEADEIGDVQHTYHTFYVGGNIAAEKSIFSDASLQYKRFSDDFGSGENRFFVKPAFDIEVAGEKIKLDFVADYVGGSFDEIPTDYSYFNLGAQPSVLFQSDDLSVQLGAGLFYSIGKMNDDSDNKFFVYPQVKASYKVVGDLMVAYAGAEGTLQQNSYADFVSQNPFVSPYLEVAPTDQKYDIYAGLKGKLASTVAYNIRAGYKNEDNRAFFIGNNIAMLSGPFEAIPPYGFGNSFGVVYDELKTVHVFGELKADFSDDVTFGVNATYNSYSTDQMEAWNLPEIQASASLDVDITEKWYAGANVFFVGERKDAITSTDFYQTVTLDSYFDLNAHVGYRYNERLTGFLRLNNIANQDYQRWYNYPVQGFQFLVGASYKFNF